MRTGPRSDPWGFIYLDKGDPLLESRVLVYFFLNGIANATCYFLLAAGLNMIFGLLGILNFAQGALFMIGAYFAFQFLQWTDNFWLSILVSPLVVAGVGAVIERYLLRRTYRFDLKFQLLLTFGLILVIEDVIRFIWGGQLAYGKRTRHTQRRDSFSWLGISCL